MNTANKYLSIIVFCSVVLNVYQYQQVKLSNFTPDIINGSSSVSEDKSTYNFLSSASVCDVKPVSTIPPNSTMPRNLATIEDTTLNNIKTSEVNNIIDNNYTKDYFESELSMYLDDDVVNLVQNGNEIEEKLKIINMLGSNDVREQDIENETKFRLLFESYSESIQSGSQDFRCNSSGCYVSYVLTNNNSSIKIFFDYPKINGSSLSGYTIGNSDGTFRYVDFIIIE